MPLNINKKKFDELTVDELYQIIHLRLKVFLEEQKIYYVDTDFLDQKCVHYFIKDGERVVSYLRLIPKGEKYEYIGIGRVVTDANYRRKGLCAALINEVLKNFKGNPVYLHGQAYLQEYYEKLGFKTISDAFVEEDVLHYEMLNENKI